VMWGFIHCLYLIGWGNRVGTLYAWARAMWFSNNRGHRIITFERAESEVEERGAGGCPAAVLPASKPAEANSAPAQKAQAG